MKRTAVPLLVLVAVLGGCRQSMVEQPKLTTYSAAKAFPHNAAARPLPPGIIDREALARNAALANPPEVTPALIARGQQRFDVFCSPCHGASGHGDGMVVQRGFPKPPSYHIPRLLAAPARHYVDVMTNGYGVMYPYAARVAPADRWAIVAYIRALQMSQSQTLAQTSTGGIRP